MSLDVLLMGAGVMYMNSDRPLVTTSEVKQWQDRIVEIDTAMHDMQQERISLARKVEAAMVFMEDIPASTSETVIESSPPEPDGHDAADLIVAAIKSVGGHGRPATIKKRLANQAPIGSYASKLAASPYFYTVLMRLTRADRLIKEEGGQYRLPQCSAQAETGAGAPGSL
jgi:hypothetical protein